jgi:hypothetical protein
MKLTIKLRDLIQSLQYALENPEEDGYTPRYLCNFIRDHAGFPRFADMENCTVAIKDLFSEYFQVTYNHRDFCTIAGWFIDSEPKYHEVSGVLIGNRYYIQPNNSGKIYLDESPYVHENPMKVRMLMLHHIVERNPDAQFSFETCISFTAKQFGLTE